MRKIPKLFLLAISSILFASFAIVSCNNDSDKKETTKDTTTVAPKMDSPVVTPPDTTKMDKANTKPTPQPN